ncbi:MAG TPA: hypothetical protein VK815_13365 [Candidatus Acidoferrales bacterium]|jgi:hypothetical protein|nr:hypothetical protein [Candidatus Acidoferrales bacterium]
MKNNKSKPESSQLLWRVFVVLFFIVVCGGLFAFGDYYRQFTADTSYSRRLAGNTVEHDTNSTIARRFMIGGGGGAILGILIVIRGMSSKEDDNDNA